MLKKLIAGFAGAIALNIVHETIRKTQGSNVPHVNELGEEALTKALDKIDVHIHGEDNKYAATLTGDIISNGIYYATTATGKVSLLSGVLAGAGAIALPSKMGLHDEPVASTTQKQIMTIGYYLLGAIVTRAVYRALKNNY